MATCLALLPPSLLHCIGSVPAAYLAHASPACRRPCRSRPALCRRRWAFGCLLWEITVYGRQPYGKKEGLLDLLKHILHDGLRLEMPAGTPGAFVQLLSTAHETDPADRADFIGMVAALKAEVAGCQGELRVFLTWA